jgi:hypothetical protein
MVSLTNLLLKGVIGTQDKICMNSPFHQLDIHKCSSLLLVIMVLGGCCLQNFVRSERSPSQKSASKGRVRNIARLLKQIDVKRGWIRKFEGYSLFIEMTFSCVL